MSREIVNAICRTFPGAEVSDPWGEGHDAWKVGGKMFACIGAVTPGVSVKTDSVETAQMLIDAGVSVKAPYFHRSWVNLPWGTSEDELGTGSQHPIGWSVPASRKRRGLSSIRLSEGERPRDDLRNRE